MGAFFQSESRSSFTVRAAFRRGLRLRLHHNASPVPGPMGTSFAVFWNACQWFGVCFLFFHSFAQCADWVDPVVPFGDYRIWGICGASVFVFSRCNSRDWCFLFFMEGRALGNASIRVDIYTSCCGNRRFAPDVRSTFAGILRMFGQGQLFFPRRQFGFKAIFP